jgi:long-chain acyl-CoA synthetase
LRALGIKQSDAVAMVMPNGPEMAAAFVAVASWAAAAPLNAAYRADEFDFYLGDLDAKALIIQGGADSPARVVAAQRKIPLIELTPDESGPAGSFTLSVPFADAGPAQPGPDDVALQLYTSGTTGLPKGVMITNANFACLDGLAGAVGLHDQSVNLVVMPLFHIAGSGWALVGLLKGAHSIILREVDPKGILDAIPRHGVTDILLVPAALMLLLADPACATTDFSTLRSFVYGASPITDKVLVQGINTLKCGFYGVYGLTETSGGITCLYPDDHDPGGPHAGRLRSIGKPFGHVEIRIVDTATGDDQPTGVVGELWTRSAQNMKGYWGKAEETARTIDADGWLRTGDAGYFDADGFIYLHDRVKDMIVSGGENIYPAEVENVLMSHPSVADVAVIGVPDERWGETVKAIVVVAAGATLDEAELTAFARERLAHFKCPTSYDTIDALPRNPSGKILKRELREPYWQGIDRRVN